MKKCLLILLSVFCLGSLEISGQAVQLSGTVVSSTDNSSLPGVSVSLKGTTIGTVTDTNGKFSLKSTPTAKTLVFSFVGFKTQEVEIGSNTTFNVVLQVDVFNVDEVVVVAYGVQQKRDVSGSVSTVKSEQIQNIPIQSFEQALQGKAAGVNVTLPNGVLGNAPVIRVRGYNSISGSSTPLIVVDGVPLIENVTTGNLQTVRNAAPTNMMGDINPSDIASIDILKDASATALYGSRAANGVMLITTKKGAEGGAKISYDGSLQWTQAAHTFDVMNAEQYVSLKNLARRNAGLGDAYFLANDANGNIVDTDWRDYIYQTGFQHNHNLTFSGANKSTNYYLSLGYLNSDGMIKTNTMERKSVRVNVDQKLNKYIGLGANISYSTTFTNSPQTGSLNGANFSTAGVGRVAFLYAPVVSPYNNDGTYNIDNSTGFIGRWNNTQSVGFFNPVYILDNNTATAQSDRIMGNMYFSLTPLKGLEFRSTLGLDYSLIESKTFWNAEHGDGRGNGGQVFNYIDRRNRWNWTNTINYSTSIINRFNLRAMVGNEEQYTYIRGWSASMIGVTDPFFTTYEGSWATPQQPPVSVLEENYFLSLFGRLSLDFDKKYFFELSGRRDGYSGLAAGKKYGNFGGASGMWNITKESFFEDSPLSKYISDLRVKASYGKVGNISGVSNYASLFLYSAGTYNNSPTLYFSQAGNADLRWEVSNKYDGGLSIGVLQDRIQLDLNYFYNKVSDLIIQVPQSPSKGIPDDQIYQNIGAMTNKGFEITLTSYNFKNNKFSWNTTLNVSTLNNEVTALAPGVPNIVGITQLETTNRTLVGYPIGNIWGVKTAGVDPQTGRRVFLKLDGRKVFYDHNQAVPANRWKYEDGTNAATINIADDGQVLGSPIPKVYGGIDNNFSFGNFDINLGLTYALGFEIYNGSKAGLRDQRNWNNSVEVYEKAWKNPGDITDIPKPIWGDNISNGSTFVQSQNVEPGDYLKIRNLSVGYNFNSPLIKNLGISRLKVYFQAFNLYTFTKYTGADPEISSNGDVNLTPGIDRNTVPQVRTIAFGINLDF